MAPTPNTMRGKVAAGAQGLKQSLTYQGRRVAPPNPQMVKRRQRLGTLAIAIVIGLALFATWFAVYMIDREREEQSRESGASQTTPVAHTVSLTSEQIATQLAVKQLPAPATGNLATLAYCWTVDETEPVVADATVKSPETSANVQETTDSAPAPESIPEEPAVTETAPSLSELSIEELAELAFPLSTRQKMAQALHGEADCVKSDAERSMVIWVILNRYDSGVAWFGVTIEGILTKPSQFAYSATAPVTERNLALVNDVCARWYLEKQGETDVGRTLPSYVYYFVADSGPGWHNRFYWTDQPLDGPRHYLDYTQPIANPYS